MNVTVLICSYGDNRWRDLGNGAALESARQQEDSTVIRLHDPDATDISDVRNRAADSAEQGWLCFLDADDHLAPDYIARMRPRLENHLLLVPSVQYGNAKPKMWPPIPIEDGNWMVIGTLVHTSVFFAAGGFRPGLGMYEDWDLWARCIRAGARPVPVPSAVYHADHTPSSRNRGPSRQEKLYWHQRIGHLNWPDLYSPTLENEDRRHKLMSTALRRTSGKSQ